MTGTKMFVMRRPVVTYFVLTFLISWSGILVVLGPGAFTGASPPTERLLALVFLAMFAGPSVAGILMTGLVNGKTGFHDLRSRLLRWRVDVRWYESLPLATLMHGSLTASTIFVFTPAATGASFLIYTWALAGAMWIVVAAVALAGSGELSRRPLQRRMA